jgi:hypothetical protein
MSSSAPTASTIAEWLDVDADELRRFVEFHPDPDVTDVVAFAETVTLDELGAETCDGVARWIADVREHPSPDELPGARVRFDGDEMGYASDLWFDHHPELEREPEGVDVE